MDYKTLKKLLEMLQSCDEQSITIEKEVVAYVNDSIFRFIEVDDKKHKYNTGVDYFLTLKNFEDKTGLYLYNIKNTKK